MSEYSFCESTTAASDTPWHIRPLTSVGQKFGGGADTRSLCGRVVSWDLPVPLTQDRLGHSCKTCVYKYLREKDRDCGG
jgi:hypothetical protein